MGKSCLITKDLSVTKISITGSVFVIFVIEIKKGGGNDD